MVNIKTIVNEPERGCGYRKSGGIYLVSDEGLLMPCGKLPIPLDICPTCHAGVHFSRGWTWIDPRPLLVDRPCESTRCVVCPASNPPERVGLLWIGEQFYKSPADFTAETRRLGVSRRISAVPRGFVAGETQVYVAHIKAITNGTGEGHPGIFHIFRPQRIEYVVKGTESEEELSAFEKRGITLVRLVRSEPTPLFDAGETLLVTPDQE